MNSFKRRTAVSRRLSKSDSSPSPSSRDSTHSYRRSANRRRSTSSSYASRSRSDISVTKPKIGTSAPSRGIDYRRNRGQASDSSVSPPRKSKEKVTTRPVITTVTGGGRRGRYGTRSPYNRSLSSSLSNNGRRRQPRSASVSIGPGQFSNRHRRHLPARSRSPHRALRRKSPAPLAAKERSNGRNINKLSSLSISSRSASPHRNSRIASRVPPRNVVRAVRQGRGPGYPTRNHAFSPIRRRPTRSPIPGRYPRHRVSPVRGITAPRRDHSNRGRPLQGDSGNLRLNGRDRDTNRTFRYTAPANPSISEPIRSGAPEKKPFNQYTVPVPEKPLVVRRQQPPLVDRSSTCPFLLRVYYNMSQHHPLEDFNKFLITPAESVGSSIVSPPEMNETSALSIETEQGTNPSIDTLKPVPENILLPEKLAALLSSELQLYTWKDTSLREIVDLVKDVCPEARNRSSRLSLKLLHLNPRGTYSLFDLGTLHNSRPGPDDRRTLLRSKFEIGDVVSIAIFPVTQRTSQIIRRSNAINPTDAAIPIDTEMPAESGEGDLEFHGTDDSNNFKPDHSNAEHPLTNEDVVLDTGIPSTSDEGKTQEFQLGEIHEDNESMQQV